MDRYELDRQPGCLGNEETLGCDLDVSECACCGCEKEVIGNHRNQFSVLVEDLYPEGAKRVDKSGVLDLGNNNSGTAYCGPPLCSLLRLDFHRGRVNYEIDVV